MLDPIGVFARNHDATAGDLFSSLADLVSRAHDIGAEEPESDAPAASASVPTTPPQAPQDSVPQKHKCGRAAAPMNEFTHGTALLYGAFWYLCPLGAGLPGAGPCNQTTRRHLLTQFHNEFAHNPQFIFLLADQVQRHAAAQGVALRVRADPESFQAISLIVSEGASFVQRLNDARSDPLGTAAWELFKSVSRFVVASGHTVPWSAEERAGEVTRLYAMWRRFGPPSCFLSLAPDDVHQSTCIRLSYGCADPRMWPATEDGLLHVLAGTASEEDVRAFELKAAAHAKTKDCTFSLDARALQFLATANPVAVTFLRTFHHGYIHRDCQHIAVPAHTKNVSAGITFERIPRHRARLELRSRHQRPQISPLPRLSPWRRVPCVVKQRCRHPEAGGSGDRRARLHVHGLHAPRCARH